MPAPEIITLQVAGRFFRDFIDTLFDVWGRTLDRTWNEMKQQFPNPLLMGLTAVSFLFDVPFIPFQALVENFGRAMVENAGYYRRYVITGEQAFKLNVEFIARGTFRAGLIDQTLIDAGFTWLASRLFHTISGGGIFARIRSLMGVKDVNDVLNILKRSITRQVALRAFTLMMAFFSIGYGVVSLLNMGLTWNETFQGLQQGNPREFGRQRNRVRKTSQMSRRLSSSQGVRETATGLQKAGKSNATRSSSRLESKS